MPPFGKLRRSRAFSCCPAPRVSAKIWLFPFKMAAPTTFRERAAKLTFCWELPCKARAVSIHSISESKARATFSASVVNSARNCNTWSRRSALTSRMNFVQARTIKSVKNNSVVTKRRLKTARPPKRSESRLTKSSEFTDEPGGGENEASGRFTGVEGGG